MGKIFSDTVRALRLPFAGAGGRCT